MNEKVVHHSIFYCSNVRYSILF